MLKTNGPRIDPKGISLKTTQLTVTCSKSTIETLEKGKKYFEVNNKNTRMTLTLFWCFYCQH